MTVRPHGAWPSPVTAASLVEQSMSLTDLRADGDDLYWVEGRPAEGGRQAVVRWAPGSAPTDVVPAGFSARTTVHEYGGGAFCVRRGAVFFSNFADQRLWRIDPGSRTPRPVTAEGARYADGEVSPDGSGVACVRERHLGTGVVNDIVVVAADGSGPPVVVAAGHDFYSSPRWSPTGRLAWLCWDHPRMPWDGTELWVAGDDRPRAGGPHESVTQPRWSPAGELHWVSDRTGWWNLYAEGRPVAPVDADLAGPDWVFGSSSYAFTPAGVLAAWVQGGVGRLGRPGGPPLDLPYTAYSGVCRLGGGRVAAVAASPTQAPAVVVVDPARAAVDVIRSSRAVGLDPAYVSAPRPVEFATSGGGTAHALVYPPVNPGFEGPAGHLPPLVVTSHGGPTAAASPVLDLRKQFWTSRGLAVADVDYRGSTGYGREYRRALDGRWGEADVDDCVAAARHLAAAGEVDGARMVIRGSSASGLTALLALTRGVFAAGASLYGVVDLAALATDTHKFESRYLDRLVGPWPAAADRYRSRSPLHRAGELSAPVILFQGADDRVVPPTQAAALVEALRRAGLPFAYLLFEGEQHGFRQADTIRRVAEAELSFYGQVLGFAPADDLEPVPIEGAPLRPPAPGR